MKQEYNKPGCAKCDKCNHVFSAVNKSLHCDGDIEVIGLKCPKCNAEFISLVTDKQLRNNINRLNNKYSELLKANAKMKKEYKYQESKVGYIPDNVMEKWMNKLEVLNAEYDALKEANLARGKELLKSYSKEE